MRWGIAFVAALLVATVCGTAASTHFVLEALEATGTEIPLADRGPAFVADLIGLGPSYAGLAAPALLVFFLLSSRLARMSGVPSLWLHAAAGGLALLVLMALLPLVFGVMPISGARSSGGLAAQVAAGVLAGIVFGLVRGRDPLA